MQPVSLEMWMCRAAAFELLAMSFLPYTREAAAALVSGEYAEACAEALAGLGTAPAEAQAAAALLAPYAAPYAATTAATATADAPADPYAATATADAPAPADPDATFHAIRIEQTALFIGEREPLIMPFVGTQAARARGEKGLLFVGRESMEIERFMRRCGVVKDLAAGHTNDPVDHIGTMCEFAAFLCLVNARAVAPAEGANVRDDDFSTFFATYFEPYARWCAARLREVSGCPLFHVVARLMTALCDNCTS